MEYPKTVLEIDFLKSIRKSLKLTDRFVVSFILKCSLLLKEDKLAFQGST